jgi:uncharacterized protein (TIGR02597 family)
MKSQFSLLSSAALLATALSPCFAQTATTKPVGYRTETIATGVFNLLSPNLDNKIGAAGAFDAVAGTTLTDNDVDFNAAFAAGDELILTITSGANAGIVQDVTAHAQHTITTAQDISSMVAIGTTYDLRKVQTIADLFGPANEAGLQAGTSSTADVIWVSNGAGGYNLFYRSSGGLAGIGWRKVGGGATDAATTPIPFTDSFFIQRKGGTNLDIVFVGHVRTQAVKTVAESGLFTPVSRLLPVGVTLADSQLQNDIAQGTSSTADVVWNPIGNGGYDLYYFSSGGLPGVGWRKVGGGATDQSTVALKSGYLIQRKAAGPATVTLRIPPGLDL